MKKNYWKAAIPFALATVFSFPTLLPDTALGMNSAIVYAAKAQIDIPAGSLHKLNIGAVTVYDFGEVKLHAYNTGDPLADEFYALESKDGLVLLESGAFKANVSEFDAYLKSLKKPLKGQFTAPMTARHRFMQQKVLWQVGERRAVFVPLPTILSKGLELKR